MYVNDYYFLYQTTGFNRLFCDMCIRYYGNLDTVITSEKGLLKYYVTDAVKFIQTKNELSEIYKNIEADLQIFEQTTDEILKNTTRYTDNQVTKEDFKLFLEKIKIILGIYVKFDHIYTDHLFTSDLSHKEKIIKLIEQKKNKYRELINAVFFNENSVLMIFADKLADQWSISKELLLSYTVSELEHMFDEHLKTSDSTCSSNFVIIRQNDFYTYYCGDKALNFISSFEKKDSITETTSEIKGMVANKGGVVTGTVKLLNVDYEKLTESIQKLSLDLPKDFIAVCESTLEEMIPVLSKSKVIITDMGGLLSHAAITSRELGIPCIVGTQNGTEVLKDGMEVEVDTNKGTVKIIS